MLYVSLIILILSPLPLLLSTNKNRLMLSSKYFAENIVFLLLLGGSYLISRISIAVYATALVVFVTNRFELSTTIVSITLLLVDTFYWFSINKLKILKIDDENFLNQALVYIFEYIALGTVTISISYLTHRLTYLL